MAKRMAGHISHIGRTRELTVWEFPAEIRRAGAAVQLPPRIVQCVLIGNWRNPGAKWYGEMEVAMRETAEWRGSAMTKLVWEVLRDHPASRLEPARLPAQARAGGGRCAREQQGSPPPTAVGRLNDARPPEPKAAPQVR